MPIYEYICTACDHRADILHGLNAPPPHFCLSCGREGTMRKLFAPPTIHYRGSGWAKKDRSTKSAKPATTATGDEKPAGSGSSEPKAPDTSSSGSTAETASSGSTAETASSGSSTSAADA